MFVWQGEIATIKNSINAISSTGAIVQVATDVLLDALERVDDPIVITTHIKNFVREEFLYLVPYKGVYLFSQSRSALRLPEDTETIIASRFWIPRF